MDRAQVRKDFERVMKSKVEKKRGVGRGAKGLEDEGEER